ncbi:hypothetical protein HYU15_02865 [Candidatus Woesearchaeota archaeon]|nr:hypothetical protein [Candidatus Woesearchaeota archaeon]
MAYGGELFLGKDGLVNRQEWEEKVESLNALADAAAPATGKRESIELVKDSIAHAVAERAEHARAANGKFGVMLSGGVDSTLIAFLCAKLGHKFACYSVGFGSSKDVAAARLASDLLGLELKAAVFSLEDVEGIIRKVLPALEKAGAADAASHVNAAKNVANVVNTGVASVAYAAAMAAKKDEVRFLFSGLGSEEVFAGYQRHEKAADVNAECWAGLRGMWQRDLLRDCAVSGLSGVSFLTPFLDEKAIVSAMRVPGHYKISGNEKKVVLREAAMELGLPEGVAFRKKIAAQYGSGFDAALAKLAKKAGFRRKSDFAASILKSVAK